MSKKDSFNIPQKSGAAAMLAQYGMGAKASIDDNNIEDLPDVTPSASPEPQTTVENNAEPVVPAPPVSVIANSPAASARVGAQKKAQNLVKLTVDLPQDIYNDMEDKILLLKRSGVKASKRSLISEGLAMVLDGGKSLTCSKGHQFTIKNTDGKTIFICPICGDTVIGQ